MKIQNAFIGFLLLVVIGGGTYFAYRRLVLPDAQCDLCGRTIHADQESMILMKDGTKLRTCCPRCALRHEQQSPSYVGAVLVTDRASGRAIRAQEAAYVEGSDEISCVPESATPPREPGVRYDTVYDRCLPVLDAFKEQNAAQEFVARHGGRILSYGQVLESVKIR